MVLLLVFDLVLKTFEDTDSGSIVVNAAGSLESSLDNRGSRDQIVSEGVVQTTLKFEQIIDTIKKLDVTLGECFEALVFVTSRVETLAKGCRNFLKNKNAKVNGGLSFSFSLCLYP